MITLPSKLENSSFYTDDPFVIFEIENFIDKSLYKDLVNELSIFEDFNYQYKAEEGDKKKISYTRNNLNEIEQPAFKQFVELVTDKSFFNWFKRTHLPHFKSRFFKVFLKHPKNRSAKLLRKINRFFKRPLSIYSIEVENSVIEKGSSIPPHTDAVFKRLSLVFYLTNDELDDEMSKSLGTIFYGKKSDGKDWKKWKSALLTKKECSEFYKDYEIKHICKFKPNTCAGFIKNDISWHAVDENRYDYKRRALVINIRELV